MRTPLLLATIALATSTAMAQVQLYDNGTFVTAMGVGANGADVAVTQTGIVTSLGNGFDVAPPNGPIKIADNFTVPADGWDLSSMNWYEVQSQSSANLYTDFRFRGAYVEVYLGNPHFGGTLVAGDMTTNRLTGGAWSGAYRVSSSAQTNQQRPIFRLDIDMSWCPVLPEGEYWVAVSASGDASTTGAVGSVPIPQQAGHNAEQFFNQNWISVPIDFPFRLFGDVATTCGTPDFDGDGDVGTDADIEAFFACLGGNCCATCFSGGADFDGDGDVGTDADIEAFFRILAGGAC